MYPFYCFRWNIIIFLALSWHLPTSSTSSDGNSTILLDRAKRLISFPINGGLSKLVIGVLVPVRFHHPLPRSVNCAFNLQANYAIRPEIIFPRPESIFKNRELDEYDDPTSRQRVYDVLEKVLKTRLGVGRKARECLLRTVCEVADAPLSHNGLVGELLDVIFTPQKTDDISSEFLMARRYGANGVDCSRLYSRCPWGMGLLDHVSKLVW